MTSRFGKTYSRKGGNGSSKFDEVFSNKRTTLSTKWGETTFMAKLGQKRPNFKPDIQEIPKKPKVEEEDTGDPFGFDSDDESLPVSSKNLAQGKGSSYSESSEAAQLEEVTSVFEANSKCSHVVGEDSFASDRCLLVEDTLIGKEKSISRIPEDNANKSSCTKLLTSDKVENFSEEHEKNSHHFHKNAEDSTKKPNAETAVASEYKADETKETNDTWNSQSGKRTESPSESCPVKGSVRTGLYEWDNDFEDIRSEDCILSLDNESLLEMKDEDLKNRIGGLENLNETFEEDIIQSVLRPSNCRTYCRANKARSSQGASNFDKLMDGTSQSLAKANSESSKDGLNQAKKGSASCGTSFRGTVGRTRDYTVLHPSCLSVCNVTIQDTMERSMDEFTASTPADLGEAGRLRKKADIATSKTTTRFRPSNTKSKKDVKLEFFGFEDHDETGGDEGGSGSSNYKIKYFGFDDLSESEDDDDDDCQVERKKDKKRTKTAPSPSQQPPPESSDNSQDSQSSTNNAENLDFTEDLPGVPESVKKPISKQGDKSKENTRKIFSGPKRSPTKAVYNARHWNHPDSEELPGPPIAKPQRVTVRLSSKEPNQKDDGVFKAPAPPLKVIKTVTIPTQPYQEIVTALKCRKEDKELYTVVQHVKHFNDVVEFGENQEFTDDIEYLLSGLKSTQPLNTRCLSVISLATKCAMPSFRMHLRAHGMVAMVFKTLDDSQHHQNLSLCTAALMYILSRDRLNMDLDRASLDLMIRLLELEQDASSAKLLNEKDMNKIKEKIRRLCETVHNKHLDLENITTGHLAMETLLSLTSKRAGDWFKEELRLLGGLDHIVDKVKECVDHLSRDDEDEEKLVASLWGAERCLRVLESVTVHNPENQSYLIAYKDSQLIISSAKALQHCEDLIQQYNRAENSICVADSNPLPYQNVTNHVGKAVEDCMRAIIGVLLNLTNDNEWGSTKTGEQEGLIGTAMNCVLQVPKYLPQEQRFDIRVLGLGLLINLVEYSARNRHCLVNMQTSCSFDSSFSSGEGDHSLRLAGQVHAVQALVQLFLERERAAQLAESKTDELIKDAPTTQHDKSGEWQETSGEIQWVSTEKTDGAEEKQKKEEEDEELDLNKALQHAGISGPRTGRRPSAQAAMANAPGPEIREKFQAALALSRVELHKNPEKEPYKSKYGARALLEEVRALLGPAPEDEDEPAADDGPGDQALGAGEPREAEGPGAQRALRLAVVEFHLGVNHIDTEELSAGEEHLVRCLSLLRPYRLSLGCVSLYIQAQNNLGILWSEREEIETARTYLESSEALYSQYMKEIGSPPLDPTEHFLPEEEKLTEQERSKRFEKVYTHNLYYLAQVYQHMEMFEKAAHYCHSTLKRQLEHNAYHPMEWAINAATLSQFYINKLCFMEARHCLSAANVIFGQTGKIPATEDTPEVEGDVPELYHQRKGEIARCWIKYCLTLMQNAQLSMQDNIGELDLDKQSELRALRKKELDEEESVRKRAVQFGTGELCDAISAVEEKVRYLRPLDFEEARELFLLGQHYVCEAKEFFQIDGYVTDHIEVVQDHSALFKVLSFFEADMERRCKMHKRRIAMLEPLTVDLNPQYYLLVSRQIQFEIAHAYYDMMDLKVAIADKLRDPDSHIVKKINSLNKSALKYYQLFLDSLRDPNKVFPEHIGEDVLRPAMLAKFRVARLYGKIITADPKKELENLATSLEHYKFIVDYCETHPEAAQEIEVELELSKEMVSLLPTKMERFRAKMALT